MGERELDRVRKIVLALPEVTERVSHGAPCFFVQGKKALCRYHDHHRGDTRVSLWCPALLGAQDELVGGNPERFFKPQASASGVFGNWIGVFLDVRPVDWNEIAVILEDAFRTVAPKKLIAQLDRGETL